MMISTYLLLLLAACVLSKGLHPLPQTRIINGFSTDIERVPWQVSIQVNGEHSCGGSLISDRIILTAAHCFYIDLFNNDSPRLLDDKEILIVAGSEFKRSREILAAVSAKMHHVGFSLAKLNDDIGIMKLVNPLPFSLKVGKIGLAAKNPAPGSMVYATGWGLLKGQNSPVDPEIIPEILQAVSIPIGAIDTCNISIHGLMTEGEICAGSATQSGCSGDSGSPLVFNNILVGVFSSFRHRCEPPGFYVSVAFYIKWIINAMNAILKK